MEKDEQRRGRYLGSGNQIKTSSCTSKPCSCGGSNPAGRAAWAVALTWELAWGVSAAARGLSDWSRAGEMESKKRGENKVPIS